MVSIGLALFFLALAWILRERDVLSGVPCALIPLAIGIGLLIDVRMSKKGAEVERLP